jgi:hypothetical protein
MVKSKLYPALVLAGISWGAVGSGCGESRRQSNGEPEGPEASGGGPVDGDAGIAGATGIAGSSGGTSGAAPVAGADSGGSAAVAGSDRTGNGGVAGDGAPIGEGGAAVVVSGAGGIPAGTSGTGGVTDAGTDAFCDKAWPTTKANPAPPPTCEDQAACGGPPNDAGNPLWLRCNTRLGDFQCDHVQVTSICESGEWVCPPDGLLSRDCRCWGPTPPGMICTEDGLVPLDGGAAGAPG